MILLPILIGTIIFDILFYCSDSLLKYKEPFSSNISTFSSISIGFLSMSFSVMFSYAEKKSFKDWKASGHFNTWIALYIFAFISNILTLTSSFIILPYPQFIDASIGLLSVSILSSILVFLPIFCSVQRLK